MNRISLVLTISALIVSPVGAEEKAKPAAPEKAVIQQDVSAKDVAATPINDLNIKKTEIPPLLITAQDKPYDLAGLGSCASLTAAIIEIEKVVGDDIDLAAAANSNMQAGRVAQSVIGAFIPFRGVIREVSGASSQDRKLRAAILAGNVRRGFLKGVGLQRGCAYPARPASVQDAARVLAEQAAADPKSKEKKDAAARAAEAAKLAEPAASATSDAPGTGATKKHPRKRRHR
jgi:hypothetical protein